MKLQRHFTKKRGRKKYYKWVVVLPDDAVELLSWEKGDELSIQFICNGKLTLSKVV